MDQLNLSRRLVWTAQITNGVSFVWLASASKHRISLALYFLGTLFVGELILRPAFGLALSDIFFLLAVMAFALEQLASHRMPTLGLPVPVVVGGLVFTIGGLVSSVLSRDRLASFETLGRIDYVIMVWLWLGTQIVTTVGQLELVARLWGVSIAVTSMGGLFELLLPGLIPGAVTSGGRIAGLTQDVSDLGGATSIALAPCLMFAIRPRASRRSRFLAYSVAALALIGLILSGSVSGFLAAACGVAFWILVGRPGRRFVLSLGAVALVGLSVVAIQAVRQGATPIQRIAEVLGRGADKRSFVATLQTRLDSDAAVLSVIHGHPLVGIGLDNASYLRAIGQLVHNIFLEAWLGGGFLAFLGLALLVAGIARAGFACIRLAPELQPMGSAAMSSFVAFIAFAMTAPVLLSRYAWIPGALIVILAQIRQRSSTSQIMEASGGRPSITAVRYVQPASP